MSKYGVVVCEKGAELGLIKGDGGLPLLFDGHRGKAKAVELQQALTRSLRVADAACRELFRTPYSSLREVSYAVVEVSE